MDLKEYSPDLLAAQPIGAWTGMAFRLVVGGLRAELAVEGLTQPHWWTLNHAAGAPGRWNRAALVERLTPYDDMDTDFSAVFDDLVARGWLTEAGPAGGMALTEEGAAGRLRAKERNARVLERAHAGVGTEEFVTTVNVLRRVVANMGGNGNLPE
ncbi:MarR family transcriptional regulator [Streptomyces yaizuensis]|uniref:MarR family transcriptional regulator n=1 Tax=Streptomyces yaizuensis TaxID=2989713 RepID=A0ABQ5NXD1_9ACTN|nr:MarR family transcriptional regulator [Streptomyces sp. YSPA8]GLF95028.1 MarR family transcriptional regulator [Streptomyces sp. YSPA8]